MATTYPRRCSCGAPLPNSTAGTVHKCTYVYASTPPSAPTTSSNQ